MSEWEQFDSAFTGISPEFITLKSPDATVVSVDVAISVGVISVDGVPSVSIVEVLLFGVNER